MSGQPVQKHEDVNKYYNQYIETLALQQSINDMNLQANKNYLLTGTMPAVSQMKDSRTTTEILADIEKLKSKIASTIATISNMQFGYGVVNGIINSPLNVDNKLLIFMAQKGPEFIIKLKKEYAIGVKGDINDIDVMVKYIEDFFNKTYGTIQTIKGYMNETKRIGEKTGLLNGDNMAILTNDIKSIITSMAIKTSKLTKFTGIEESEFHDSVELLEKLVLKLSKFSTLIPTNKSMRKLKDKITEFFTNEDKYDNDELADDIQSYSNYLKIIESIPKPSINSIYTLLNMLENKLKTNTKKGYIDIINRLDGLFSGLFTKENRVLINEIPADIISIFREPDTYNPDQNDDGSDYGDFGLPTHTPQRIPGGIAVRSPGEIPEIQQQPIQRIPERPQPIRPGSGRPDMSSVLHELTNKQLKKVVSALNKSDAEQLLDNIKNIKSGLKKTPEREEYVKKNISIDNILKEQRKKMGLSDIDESGKGLIKYSKKPKRSNFRGFGIAEINHKKLDMGILSIRRPSKGNYKSVPQQRISPTLQNIIKDINGGKVPNFNDISSLTSDEKEYLHKVVCASGFDEKFSIPTPNKDAIEKEIHQFEVLKGEIMSGNDSKALIKKFKILILKLANKGSLGKKEANDVLYTLLSLGY
jgi:hypothetical protein